MSAGGIVGAGLRIWIESWFKWFIVSLLMGGVVAILVAAIDPWTATYGTEFRFGERPFSGPDPDPFAVVLVLIGALFLAPWQVVILTRSALRATFADPLEASTLVGRTIRGFHSMLWILVLLVLCALLISFILAFPLGAIAVTSNAEGVLAVLGLVILGLFLWLVPRLATVSEVFVGEDARGTKAILGAWRLSKGAWGTSAAVLVLSILIGIAIGLVPSLIAWELFPSPVVEDAVPRAIVQSLVNSILTPMGIAVTAALYLELRARKGLIDQSHLRAKLARFDPG